jgi:hypothetical protein
MTGLRQTFSTDAIPAAGALAAQRRRTASSPAAGGAHLREEEVLNRLTIAVGLGATLAFSSSLSVAHAADPEFCKQYAQAAINQVRAGLAVPACARGFQGDRWSSDFKVHYSWCLTAAPPAAESERGARTGYLRACRGR